MGRGQNYQWALTADTVEAVITAVEWTIPFHLNLVFEELRAVVVEQQRSPSPQLVEFALQRLIAHGRTHFDHWDERLAKMLDGRTREHCEIILGLVCRDPRGVALDTVDLRMNREILDARARTETIRLLVDLLTSDGYLVRQDDLLRFRSALLRRYWLEVQG